MTGRSLFDVSGGCFFGLSLYGVFRLLESDSAVQLECAHCYMSAHAGADTRGELTTTECRRVMDEIAAVNPNVFLILTGGEPLLRRDVWDVAATRWPRSSRPSSAPTVCCCARRKRLMREHGVLGASISLDSTDR